MKSVSGPQVLNGGDGHDGEGYPSEGMQPGDLGVVVVEGRAPGEGPRSREAPKYAWVRKHLAPGRCWGGEGCLGLLGLHCTVRCTELPGCSCGGVQLALLAPRLELLLSPSVATRAIISILAKPKITTTLLCAPIRAPYFTT